MSQENLVCPLCMECLDIDDHTFIPCTCGYQICRFCWHRIKTAESGTCPACRKPYTEGPAQFQPLSTTELQEIKKKQKLKESEEKKKSLEKCNKYFANARVIQKNLMFVVGLPANIADSEMLRRQEYFGKLGKITKITLTKMTPPMVSMTTAHQNGTNGNNTSTYQFQSAYVMFARIEDALRAIKSINSSQNQFGKSVKASLGTTKYCSRFIKGLPCLKPECMYLHETVDEEACFTKEEIQQGKHTTYEQKLYSQYCKDEPDPRTPSPSAQVPTINGAQKQTPCSQSKTTTQSTPVSLKKPLDLGLTNCWKVGGAAIVKASLATSYSPVTNQKKPLTAAPQNGTVAAMLKQSVEKKTSDVEKSKTEDQNGRLSPVVTNDRNPSTSSSSDDIEENFERLSYASSRTSNEGDVDSNSSEAVTPELPPTPQETSSPSSEEGISADALTLEDRKEEEPRQATPNFFDGVKDEIPSTPTRNFYDDISSTPAAKRVLPPSLLDVSDIEADLTDLKVDDQNSSSLDCSRDDDRHDDDIDPWKIVSIGLDMMENERILEERPQYCQTTTHQEEHGSSLLASCGIQSLRDNSRLSQYDPFNSSRNKSNNNGHSMMNNTDFLDSAVRSNFHQQQQLEEMLHQRRQQQQRLLMLQQQAMRSPSYPSLTDSFFGQDSNFMPSQSLFRSQQDQQSSMLGQYSNGPLHQQQHLQQQQYLFLQQQRQQQLQRQQFELANQRLQMSGMFNGHQHGNAPFMNGHSQQEQLSQSLPIEHKRWQDGLKALFPNVNISFGPSPPFVKEAPPTTQHDNISINASFRTRVENGSMHDMATLDPAIVNTGAVANHQSNNDNYLVQQQQQYSQLGLNFPLDNYARAHSMQQPPTMNARPYDWPVLTNGMSEASHNVPQLVRRTNAVPPPPGFEKMHPQKTEL